MQKYRNLRESEIKKMESQGCRASNWADVAVAEGFDPAMIRGCSFRGAVKIGRDVYINNIGSYISNYEICDGAYIENVGLLEVVGESAFGNGVQAAVINEAGGREVPLFDELTAQTAYVMAMYRDRGATIARLEAMVGEYCRSVASSIGTVGARARITNSGILRDVRIGEAAVIEGVSILSNGTVNSAAESPSVIGAGVKLYGFVTRPGAYIDGGAMLKKCFVGEGVRICGLTANDSLFFANSHFENGEVCSIFAGPFTVSHHKSSLLIAGMFSFFNAGSGSNQSNHLFKTGAVHQGIHRRGCKFGSDAYVILPARNGAFNVVIGRHKSHYDTEDFPYSYLVEDSGVSYLLPAMNLTSCGTVRDINKWRERDIRSAFKSDNINFEEDNPFVTERVLRAIKLSYELLARQDADEYSWARLRIRATMLRRGLKLYELARDKFIGAMLEDASPVPAGISGAGTWIDAAGMFMPKSVMDAILEDVDSGRINTIGELRGRFDDVFANYRSYAYDWAIGSLGENLGTRVSEADVESAIERGRQAADKLRKITDDDRRKDYENLMTVGYGIDAVEEEIRMADFRAVRGI